VSTQWTQAFTLTELPAGTSRVFVRGHQRIAVFHLSGDGVAEGETLAAIDDRCPHEGYPLAKGFVNGCVVTCRWHAFRFDLRTGQCLVGDEHARAYPVRVNEQGIVELDLAEPDQAGERARHEASLVRGLERRRTGQIARDIVRLLDTGLSARDVAMLGVRFDARHAPNGTTHVPALAHDLLARLPAIVARHGAEGEVSVLLQILDLAAEPNLGFEARVIPMPAIIAWSAAERTKALAELRSRVESEDADGAEAWVLGALQAGVSLAAIEEWLRALVSDHLLNLGHGHIFLPKVFALIADRSAADVAAVVGAFVRRLALAPREELVPEWSWVVRALAAAVTPDEEGLRGNLAPLIHALLDGSRKELFEALEVAIASRPYDAIVDALVIAASVRLLRYDLQVELDPTIQESWLDVTHTLTHASSLRAFATLDSAARRRILYLASAFVHTRGGLDAPADTRVFDEAPLFAEAPAVIANSHAQVHHEDDDTLVDHVTHALERRDADAVVHAAQALFLVDRAALVATLEDWCLMRGATRPIFAAHQWKTLIAADLESQRLAASSDPFIARASSLPLLAAARFIGSPLTERAPLQAAHEALRFVRESRVPRRRT